MADPCTQPTDDGRDLCGRCMNPAPCGCYSREAHLGLPFPSEPDVILAAFDDHCRELHATVRSVEQERDALKAECLRLALDNGHLRRQMHRAVTALLSAQPVDLVVDMLRSVSVEEGTGHE